MKKSIFFCKALFSLAIIFFASQNVQAASCADAVCGAICDKAPWGSGTICKKACPTVGSSAISAGCKSDDPCKTICAKMPSVISGFCASACTKAGPAITKACQSCSASSLFEEDASSLFEDAQQAL